MRIDRNSLSGNRLRRNLQRLSVGTATSSTLVDPKGGIVNTDAGIALDISGEGSLLTVGSTGAVTYVPVGTQGQVLTVNSTSFTGLMWINGSDIVGGPYLPLSAGSTVPLTGTLWVASTLGIQCDISTNLQSDGYGNTTLSTGTLDLIAPVSVGWLAIDGSQPSTSIVTGNGAGHGGSLNINLQGYDNAGTISLRTGSTGSLATNSPVVILTFGTPFPNDSSVIIYPGNANANNLVAGTTQVRAEGLNTGTQWEIVSGSVALAANTPYVWNYLALGW